MPFRGIADETQLATLTRILDDYCEQAGIEGSHPAREHLARRLIALFSGGIDSPDDLRMALHAFTGPVMFGWMNGARLPVIVSIDFSSGPWTSRRAW